jgi:murein endopeptidase
VEFDFKSTSRSTLRRLKSGLFILIVINLGANFTHSALAEEMIPDSPESAPLMAAPGEPSLDFCSEWNPEFAYRGYRCCSTQVSRTYASTKRARRFVKNSCAPDRIKWTFCDEMTPNQKDYIEDVKSGRIKDVLENIDLSMGRKGNQSFCSTGNGFLVYGRPLLPTEDNRLEFRNLPRCANFGTDPLIGMMEWAGREVKREYFEKEFSDIRLVIGDLSAPRGGCIAGRRGRRAHKSHTGGQDIDLAYFNPRLGHHPEERFTRTFYVASNWWFLKKVFANPYACVKVIFVDKKNIAKLARYAKDDPEWEKLKPFIRHVRGHRDHFHIRVGEGPGVPGCRVDPNLEEDEDIADFSEVPTLESEKDSEKDDETSEEGALPSSEGAQHGASKAPLDGAFAVLASAPGAGTDQVLLAKTRLDKRMDHKLEPMVSMQYEEKTKKRRRRPASHKKRH